jgi:hypothetical protein
MLANPDAAPRHRRETFNFRHRARHRARRCKKASAPLLVATAKPRPTSFAPPLLHPHTQRERSSNRRIGPPPVLYGWAAGPLAVLSCRVKASLGGRVIAEAEANQTRLGRRDRGVGGGGVKTVLSYQW